MELYLQVFLLKNKLNLQGVTPGRSIIEASILYCNRIAKKIKFF